MRLVLSALAALALATAPLGAAGPAFAAGGEAKKDAPGPNDRAAKRISSAASYVYGPTVVSALVTRLGSHRQSLTVELGWEASDAALRGRMALLRPRLQDAIRTAVSEYAANRHRPGAAPNLDQLTLLLQQATDATLGQAGAKVMLANVVILQR
jgi:hypothetical protein